MDEVLIVGGGPAGAAAAISACAEGARARIVERATACRHKVCGEFLSPYSADVLTALDVWEEFQSLGPRPIRRCVLHLGQGVKQWILEEPAWGLSRVKLDGLLLRKAESAGAVVARGTIFDGASPSVPARLIAASGRKPEFGKMDRLFGFKAHFEGPCDDAVELFFTRHGYAGVSGVEGGMTNVCALAPESVLRRHGFDFDELLCSGGPLAERLRPLHRTMDWVTTGPLSFRMADARRASDVYPAGDALGFIDPYTGTGILNALLTGRMAGIAAARGTPVNEYLADCAGRLGRAFRVSSILRRFATHVEAHWMARWIPGRALFRWTRVNGA
jgi:flavin-dependent dehydrogenase